jgi:hypothetical protein
LRLLVIVLDGVIDLADFVAALAGRDVLGARGRHDASIGCEPVSYQFQSQRLL